MSYLIAFLYGAAIFYIHNFFPFTSIFLSLLLLLLISFVRYKEQKKFLSSLLYAMALVIIASSGFHYAKHFYIYEVSPSDIAGKTLKIQCTAKTMAAALNPQNNKFRQTVQIKKAFDEDNRAINLKEMRLLSDSILSYDKIYLIKVRIPRDSYFLNPGSSYMPSGYTVEIKEAGSSQGGFFKDSRIKLNYFIKESFSSESAPFLLSIITGERSLLTKEMRDAFNVTGLAHILSISGAHFGLLLFILFGVFRFLVKALPYNMLARLTLYLTPSQIAAILCIPFMIGYLGISSMSAPSIRAFIMITLFLFGLLIHRKGFWINTLLLAAVIIILIQPDSLLDLSFQLSFIAVLCIGLVAGQQGSRAAEGTVPDFVVSAQSNDLRTGSSKALGGAVALESGLSLSQPLLRYFSTSLKISLAATIGTAPLVAYHFHYFSLISPVANLIITPIIGFIILPLSLVFSFVFLISGVFPLHSFIDAITVFVLAVIKHIGQWSFVDIKVAAFPPILLVMFYLGILVYIVIKFMRCASNSQLLSAYGMLLASAIAIIPMITHIGVKFFEHKGLHITYLDVGQGNSAVIELPDNRTIVIDTGRKGFQTAEFLKYRGVRVIDAVILSHGSSDHTGGLWHLMRDFNIQEIWDNGMLIYPEELPKNTNQKKLKRGDIFEGDGYKIVVLHPYDGFYTMKSNGGDENNVSLVINIQGAKKSFLFTGDIEEEAQEDLSHLGDYLKSNVLKVPHHGSRTSKSETFLDVVSPEIAVISAGRKNIYGHPHVEILDMLRTLKVFRTDRDGAVGIRELADGKIEVKTWNKFRLAEASNIRDEFLNFKKLFSVW